MTRPHLSTVIAFFQVPVIGLCLLGIFCVSIAPAQDGGVTGSDPDSSTSGSSGSDNTKTDNEEDRTRDDRTLEVPASSRHRGDKPLQKSWHASIDSGTGTIHDQPLVPDEKPLVEKADIKVYQSASTVIIPATVVVRNAILELFLCAKNGKSHESLLMMEERPKKMNLSLIMAGFSPEEKPVETGPQYLGDPTLPRGDSVVALVEWELKNGQWVRYRAEDLIRNLHENMIMRRLGWRFAGSYFMKETTPDQQERTIFAASRIKTLIALFHDPSAILDLPAPQGGTDGLYAPRSRVVPPVGTSVRLILRKPTSDEQSEIDQNIEDSRKAWKKRQEQLEKRQERRQ
jgi:hypothetical protein